MQAVVEKPGRGRTPEFVVIGTVSRPHGIKGTLRIHSMTDDPQRYHLLERVFLTRTKTQRTEFKVQSVQVTDKAILLKLDEINTRNDAELWRQADVEIPGDEVLDLEDDHFYYFELIGLSVFTTTGQLVGQVRDVLLQNEQDLFVIQSDENEYLIPDVPQIIIEINLDEEKMIIDPPPGLLEL